MKAWEILKDIVLYHKEQRLKEAKEKIAMRNFSRCETMAIREAYEKCCQGCEKQFDRSCKCSCSKYDRVINEIIGRYYEQFIK